MPLNGKIYIFETVYVALVQLFRMFNIFNFK
jgi:hypothetical protein